MDALDNPLRAYRRARGIPIEKMAEKLGLSSASLSRIERGEQWPSTRGFFERLREATDGEVKADDLVAPHAGEENAQ